MPTYKVPYFQDFEKNEGFWRSMGNQIWEYGAPAGSVINSASSGTKSWVTGLIQDYGDIISRKNKIIIEDDFEYDLGWTFSGEFERNIPDYGNLPYFATSGYYCIGIDLSGQGALPFNYEKGISPATAYNAVSPAFDVRNYSNLNVGCSAWISINQGDSVKFEASQDNGTTWHTIWKNTEGAIFDDDYIYREFHVPDYLCNSDKLRFRFSLFYSSASAPAAQGWSIDDFVLTGDLVNTNEGYLTSPGFDLTGLTNPVFEARLWLETEQNVDGATLLYSLDDGNNWTPVSNTSGFDAYWNWYTGKPVQALGLNGWSGHTNGWLTARHLLPAELIGKKNVQFRFKFMTDKFNNQYNGIAVDDFRITEAPFDMGISEILSPVTACELGSDQKFTLRLKNYGLKGMQTGDSIRIGYFIERSGKIQASEETIYLAQSFPAGTTRDFIMENRFDFSVPGEYKTNVFTIEENPFFYNATSNDSIYRVIRVNKPFVQLGPDISTIRPDTVILKAFSGIAGYDYLWNDGSTDSVYHVSTQGTYHVRVTNDIGCVTRDTINVTQLIADVGVSELVSPVSSCELGTNVPVEIMIKNFGTDIVGINDSIFIYREINSALLKDTVIISQQLLPGSTINYTYSSGFDFSVPDIYKMKLYTRFRDDFRNNDTLKYNLEVFGYPDIDLGRDTVMMAPGYILSVPTGYDTYLWQDGSALNTFTVDQAGQGLYYVTVGDEHQCEARDSIRITLNMTDIKLDRILSPETSCDLSETITVSVRVRNTGNQLIPAGQTIGLGYKVDENLPNQESVILSKNFLPGDSIDFIFSQKNQVVTGSWYDFTVYVNYVNDMKSWNDTILMPVGVFESPVVNLGADFRVVTALEYVLDAGPGFASYLWHDGSTGQSFTIKNPGINVCKVIVTDLNGCTNFDEVNIMLAVPDIGITGIINPVTSCSLGTSEKVKVAIKNLGNWDIDKSAIIAVSYSINGAPPIIENVILNATFEHNTVIYHTFSNAVDLSIPGSYEIVTSTIYGSDQIPSNNTLKVNYAILVRPVVDIVVGQDTVLTYNSLTLSAPSGYASYKWQDGSTGLDFGINTPGAAMYSVLVTGINGCSARDSVFVAYDVPDLGITRIVTPLSSCKLDQNNPVSIEIINNGFYRISTDKTITISYQVNGGNSITENIRLNIALQAGQSRVLTFAARYNFSTPGNYQLNVSLNYTPDEKSSNNSLSNSVSVWGFPEVEIGAGKDTIKTYTLPITLDAGTGFASYQWQDNSQGNTLNVNQWNLYWVKVTDGHGCSSADSVYVYSPFNINDLQIFPGKVKIYPNPVQDVLHVTADMEAVKNNLRMELFDLKSILVYRKDFKQIQSADNDIYVNGFAPGEYFLRISVDKVSHTYKVIVK